MILSVIAALLLVQATAEAAQLSADIFVRDAALGTAPGGDRLITDVQLGKPGAEDRLNAWLKRPGVAESAKADALLVLCGAYFREQRFADGVRVCSEADKIRSGAANNMIGVHRAFLSAGPARWSS